MKYSVIIPIYNVEKYLSQCIESVISQSYKDIELILVDDGSPDNSGRICDEYAEKDSRITVVHKKNGGVAQARKCGVEKAIGDYVVCVDGDDFIKDGFFSTVDGYISKYNPDVFVMSYCCVDESGNPCDGSVFNNVFSGEISGEQLQKLKHGFCYDKNIKGANFGGLGYSLWTKAVKRDIFLSAQTSASDDTRYGEDMIVTKLVLDDERTKKIYISNYQGYCYRQNPTSAINSANINSLKNYEKTLTEMESVFKGEEYKIAVYAYRVLTDTISKTAKVSENFKQFKSLAELSYKYGKIWNYAQKCKIYKPTVKDKIKKTLIKNRQIRFMYLLFKK